MLNKIRFYFIGIVLALLFFILSVATISDYGLNIDESIHFIRGQAYLKLLTSGKATYSKNDLSGDRVSRYKLQQYNGKYFLKNDSGHPPLSGILASVFNRVFYEKLGILGDLESYHLFEIFISCLLVFLVFVMAGERYGVFAGIISSSALILYPLFLGESHFNIKDPIETAFYAFTVYFFYLAVEYKKAKYFIPSAFFFGLAFSTKFNILFLPFTILPYLIIRYWNSLSYLKLKIIKKIPLRVYLYLLLFPIIGIVIQFSTRPYLWSDPLNKFMQIVGYYKSIGTSQFYSSQFLIGGWNIYAPFFISISTPLYILFLFLAGTIYGFLRLVRERDKFFILLILWMIVPIARVMYPNTNIYSGVRQIMEYIPPLAIICGIGAIGIRNLILRFWRQSLVISIFILMGFIPLIFQLWKLHPNENVYVNFLVGGLKGAYDKKIPGAGESMGNVYLQGLKWLNKNAEKNARYQLPVGLGSNIPTQFARKDISLGPNFSGIKRKGEYMMEMFSVDFPPTRYSLEYLNKFIDPVYEFKVDSVALLKIWKNDIGHTRKGYLNEGEEKNIKVSGGTGDEFIAITLPNPSFITRLEIEYDNKNCIQERSGRITYTADKKNINYAPDDLSNAQGSYASTLQKDNLFVYFFAAYPAKYIQLFPDDPRSCLLQYKKVNVQILQDIKP